MDTCFSVPMWIICLIAFFAIMGFYSIYQAIPKSGKGKGHKNPPPSSSALCNGEIVECESPYKPGTLYGYDTIPIRYDITGETIQIVCIDNDTIASFVVPKDQVSNSEGARYVAINAMRNQSISVIGEKKIRISDLFNSYCPF